MLAQILGKRLRPPRGASRKGVSQKKLPKTCHRPGASQKPSGSRGKKGAETTSFRRRGEKRKEDGEETRRERRREKKRDNKKRRERTNKNEKTKRVVLIKTNVSWSEPCILIGGQGQLV